MRGVDAIRQLNQVAQQSGIAQTVRPQQAATPFASILQDTVSKAVSVEHKAQQTVTGLLDGSGVEIHDAMIATQKADLAFELALQVRNKAITAYQQMMQMQF